jgi:hypothetical protein
MRTHQETQQAWNAVGNLLMQQARVELSAQVPRFAARMPRPITERVWIAARLVGHSRKLCAREPMKRWRSGRYLRAATSVLPRPALGWAQGWWLYLRRSSKPS